MNEEMQTEIEKRIEVELESIWNGERKEVEYKFKNFDTGFRVGAKFILMLPELREIREVLEWYATTIIMIFILFSSFLYLPLLFQTHSSLYPNPNTFFRYIGDPASVSIFFRSRLIVTLTVLSTTNWPSSPHTYSRIFSFVSTLP